jgi:hypothetical protein
MGLFSQVSLLFWHFWVVFPILFFIAFPIAGVCTSYSVLVLAAWTRTFQEAFLLPFDMSIILTTGSADISFPR